MRLWNPSNQVFVCVVFHNTQISLPYRDKYGKVFCGVRNMFNVRIFAGEFVTLGILAIYRLGAHIGAPGINRDD